MLKNLIVLPDGTEIFSGSGTVNAIKNTKITECVNSETELTLGSVCSSAVEMTVIAPRGGLHIAEGTEFTLYKVDGSGTRHKAGLFTMEKPTKPSANIYKITAFDRVSWLDKDLSEWIAGLDGWPYKLRDFARMVCTECGLNLLTEDIPNGDYEIQAFGGDGITGRQLMRWVGEACARFCRATPDGDIEFAWYTPLEGVSIGPTASADGTQMYYFQGSLTYEDYQTAAIEKVQIKLTSEDVGVVYPQIVGNTYIIMGNYLLTSGTTDRLAPVAQVIYEQLQGVAYTPCKVSVPANLRIRAGDIISITDQNGVQFTAYVMTKTQSGQRDTLECTGSARRDSTSVVNNQSFKNLSGKVFNLSVGLEGMKVENRERDKKYAEIALDVDGIESKVANQEEAVGNIQQDMTAVKQSAQDVSIKVQKVIDDGVSKVTTGMGFTFNDNGLLVKKDGEQISNLVDHTGVHVKRGEEVMLQADANGVIATDVTVRNYLIVGSHARFEDYTDGTDSERTACFWI